MRFPSTEKKDDLDLLFVIFEQHLYNFEESSTDRKTFIDNIVKEYLAYLTKAGILVPKQLEASVMEELSIQVNQMFVKKVYGCLSMEDFRRKTETEKKKKARSKYKRLRSLRFGTK